MSGVGVHEMPNPQLYQGFCAWNTEQAIVSQNLRTENETP
jgi:hypothetical protein